MDILSKIKKANLVGCGGGCFPTAQKWEAVKQARGISKFVVCNCSEGEPNVEKDGYILKHWPEKVIAGMKLAMDFLSNGGKKCVKGYFYINHDYYNKYGVKIRKLIKKSGARIVMFVKPEEAGYIGGEETAALNLIEEKEAEPRLRPPYPTTNGLWNAPTIINNVETFYNASLASEGKYKGERFYTIDGDCLKKGVFKLPGNWPVEKVLKETKNWPRYDFFVQIGGGASGEVLNKKQLGNPARGAMSLTLYETKDWEPIKVIRDWVEFFMEESCGQCTPCREGTYRLWEIINEKNPDWNLFSEILDNLEESSFCGLGCSVPIPIRSYVKNVLLSGNIKTLGKDAKTICECFK